MPSPRLALLLTLSTALADAAPLRVLRTAPSGDATPGDEITITFDRPVAGSLDRTVDPAGLVSLQPAIPGRTEWRDPVTLRFQPARPLVAGTIYRVTVANSFAAMDGSRLAEPYAFSFRVRGPRVLTGLPTNGDAREANLPAPARFVEPNAKFDLVVSAPVAAADVASRAHLELSPLCGGETVVRLKGVGRRALRDADPWFFREAGGWERNRALDSLRRVVSLQPERPLPRDCAGHLVLPSHLDAAGGGTPLRWPFRTYGDFRLERAQCAYASCPTGPIRVEFSTPVRGAALLKSVRLVPETPFTVSDSSDERSAWILEAELDPRKGYAVVADSALRDVFGQPLRGNPVSAFATTGYAPGAEYPFGRLVVERQGLRTLAVRHVNIDTLLVTIASVPESLEAAFLSRSTWSLDDAFARVAAGAEVRRVAVRNERDRTRVTGVRLPGYHAQRPGSPTLLAVRVSGVGVDTRRAAPLALVQVTDLGIHARVGATEAAVWVTGASDGRARPGVAVTLHDVKGRALARGTTGPDGVVRLTGYRMEPPSGEDEDGESWAGWGFEGYVAAAQGPDRAVVGISQYDPDLSPWRFNVSPAWEEDRHPFAGTVFTERGIYRPGEPVFAKAILRRGMLGSLTAPALDSVRWTFTDRDGGSLKDSVATLSEFGTAELRMTVPTDAPLGYYAVRVDRHREGKWRTVAETSYRVAEYRPPEFLAEVTADPKPRFGGDSLRATVQGRYLFGAPMAGASVSWTVVQRGGHPWGISLPGTEGYYVGQTGWWWEEQSGGENTLVGSGTDSLDATGHLDLTVRLGAPTRGVPADAVVSATVTDVNRQTVTASRSVRVHPSDFYLGAKPLGTGYFWSAGKPQSIGVIAVTPEGGRLAGIAVTGTIVRREWHQVRRERDGYAELVGEWVEDTVAQCALTTAQEPVACAVTPPKGGTYIATFTATDAKGRPAVTALYRWASGPDWVPWGDESQFKMDVIPDRTRYAVGDTATVLLASPFTDAEAWITVEREGLIEQRRLRLSAGATTLTLPITEALVPNAFVSVLVARGRSAAPGPLDDPGRPTIRVGYAELRVTPEVKRLAVQVEPLQREYRPADTARVAVRVKDAAGRGRRSEVTLWAVDEGVLALTGYRTPDPLDAIYRRRGLGLRLASNLVAVAPQVPEGEKGRREPGGGGGGEGGDVLRSRFQTTAFFLGSVVTDAAGSAVASARLPDNLTTFRVMAVAVTADDRFGSGESSLLVTKPLLARPALPRFIRPGDTFSAGAVVNQRSGGTPTVRVEAAAQGAELRGSATQSFTLEPGRGREARFDFAGRPGDSARFTFRVTDGRETDRVETRLRIRPDHHPRAHTIAGVVYDTATAVFTLPGDIDPARSTLELSLGASPLAMMQGIYLSLRAYPYGCTEQITSSVLPVLALYRLQQRPGVPKLLRGNAARDIQEAVDVLSRRQRADGGIGLWSGEGWTTPWTSAYAGRLLIEAKAAGFTVSDSALARLGGYLQEHLRADRPAPTPVSAWLDRSSVRLTEALAAAEYFRARGRPNVPLENELVRSVGLLSWEDRLRLARILQRRGDGAGATRFVQEAWRSVRIEGRRAVLPDSAYSDFYFRSTQRPAALLLLATLATDPAHPSLGALVETMVQQGRSREGRYSWWNTQDYASVLEALAEFELQQRTAAGRGVRIRAGRTTLFRSGAEGVVGDTTVTLDGLLTGRPDGTTALSVAVEATAPGGPLYYYLTVREVPRRQPVNPDEAGIQVSRWYEGYEDGRPIIAVAEGDLVRVRLRVTVPATRYFLALGDALPAGLEAVDLSLRTSGLPPGPGLRAAEVEAGEMWGYGSWDGGWWSPFDHRELRDDRVLWIATVLWPGTYNVSYVARATTPGVFVRPPAHAEEMYNPAVNGRSDGGVFTITARPR